MDTTGGRKENRSSGRCFGGLKQTKAAGRLYVGDMSNARADEPLTSLLSFHTNDDASQDTDELYLCLRKDRDVVWESIFDDDTTYRKLPHEILKDMVDADEGAKKKPYEELSLESKLLVEEMRERMGMLARNEISMEDLEGETFVLGDPC